VLRGSSPVRFQHFSVSAFQLFPNVPSTPSSEGPVVRGPVVRGPIASGPWSLVLGLWSVVRSPWSVVLPLAAFSLLWFDLCRQLSYVWQTNEQYAYGWFVPILALGLFLKKWPDRPLTIDHGPQTTDSQLPAAPKQCEGRSDFSFSAFQLFSVFTLALLLLPLRVISEINQDWPLISWLYALIVVALTLYALHLAGPPSSVLCPPSSGPPCSFQLSAFSFSAFSERPWSLVSPWLRHFAFPVCFILVAVQWPYRIEHNLTQGLMRLDTNITVELLGWLNIPAMQHGNLIELTTGSVGVDEACSGIRSFQSTLMAALLLGEFYLLARRARLLLVVGGLVLAFGFNVLRTLLLAWQSSAGGTQALEKWHDPAGFTITIACFLVLWAIAVFVKRRTTGLQDYRTTGPRRQRPRTTDYGPRTPSPPPPL
jgi:exosortase